MNNLHHSFESYRLTYIQTDKKSVVTLVTWQRWWSHRVVKFLEIPTARVHNWPQLYLLSNFYLHILVLCCTCQITSWHHFHMGFNNCDLTSLLLAKISRNENIRYVVGQLCSSVYLFVTLFACSSAPTTQVTIPKMQFSPNVTQM